MAFTPTQHCYIWEIPLSETNLYLGLAGFDQNFTDLEVKHLVVPPTGQNVVAHTGQGVMYEEISIPQNQSLWHLNDANSIPC